MNHIIQKRIEEAAKKEPWLSEESFVNGCNFILNNLWISVEEALPEDYEDVFVRNESGDYTSAWIVNGDWHLSCGEIAGDDLIDSKITHWTPIPQMKVGEK